MVRGIVWGDFLEAVEEPAVVAPAIAIHAYEEGVGLKLSDVPSDCLAVRASTMTQK